MNASDISEQALGYLKDVELFRVRSGRLQDGLSGELKKRTQCLEEIIRVLQYKAEDSGDPGVLRNKINELLGEIRKNKLEEKRKREMEDLQEVIREQTRKQKHQRRTEEVKGRYR